jgi:two-component system response regulator VicR
MEYPDTQEPTETPASDEHDSGADNDASPSLHRRKTAVHVPRVLIVEDTVELGELIRATLERMDMLAFHETHGAPALERFDEIRPDLVLLDIGLPDMSGWRVLDAIKEAKLAFSRPAIVIITAYGDPANRLMGKLQGVGGYLNKPFTRDEIESVVLEALGRKVKDD